MSSSSGIVIIPAQPCHLPEIIAIEKQLDSPWSEGQIADELTLAHGWQFVAINPISEKVFGFIIGSICIDEAEIRKFAIASQERRKGYGRILLAHCLIFLDNQFTRVCFLELRESNTAALQLYTFFDFQKIGLRKNYYSNPCENAIILQKQFSREGDLGENN
nr:ribosomal protein S18-alanine N-acetyltransferase [Desulfobulbaceae bacterium]